MSAKCTHLLSSVIRSVMHMLFAVPEQPCKIRISSGVKQKCKFLFKFQYPNNQW